MKHHEAIVNYKESLGTGSVSVNAVSQLFPGRESCDPSRGEKNSDHVDTVALNAEKVQLGRKQLADAKHGQTVAGQLSVVFHGQQIEICMHFYLPGSHRLYLGAMNRGMSMLAAGSTSLADKIEIYATNAQLNAKQQMENAKEVAVKNAEHKTLEIGLKKQKLDMQIAAKKEEQTSLNIAAKSKFALEMIQHIPTEKREAFIREFLSDNYK